MNLLYPEMDSPSGPSIMGSENPKFSERRNGQSDSDSTSEAHTPMEGMNTSILTSRRSKDGLSRDERMRLVRERQMEEHKRRLEELRQAQNQAMKAKQQQDEERKRRLEEIKNRDEQRRAAVDARRKRMEDEERERCEAIIRKHQEIFDRIDSKKRQHESRKMAYGLSTYQLSDQDSVYTGGQPSRRAISASALSRRGHQTSRSHHQSTARFSPGTAQSARLRPSPSTPSRNGGGQFDSFSGSKTTSSENSPSHSGRHIRNAQSHPPPISRNRVPTETARSKPGSRPQTAQFDTQSARAKRPTSLMTRSIRVERAEKVATPDAAFRTMSKRSQSVGNVSARGRTKRPVETLKPAVSQRDVTPTSPRKTEEVRFEEVPDTDSPEPALTRTGRKVISEAEAKAALAEKRRQARLKVEFERTQPTDVSSEEQPTETPADSQPPSTLGVESPFREQTPRRASEIEFLELERSFTEESRPVQTIVFSKERQASPLTVSTPQNEPNPDSFLPHPEEDTVGSGVLTNGGGESPEVAEDASETLVRDVEVSEREPETQEVVVEREVMVKPDVSGDVSVSVISEEPIVQEVMSEEKVSPSPVVLSPAEVVRLENERRRVETEQREEEERNARRQRLEAIKRLTKGGSAAVSGGSNFTGSTERLASPATETAKPIDALENARKLLQRKGLGGTEPSSLVSSPSTGSFRAPFVEQGESLRVNGMADVTEGKSSVLEDMRSATGTPFSDVSSTDTVSLNGYIRSQDDEGLQNGVVKTGGRNGSVSGMSGTSSIDFDPYSSKDDWHHLNGNEKRPDLYNGGSNQLATLMPGNPDLLLSFDAN